MNGRYLLDTNAIINLLNDVNADFSFKEKKGVGSIICLAPKFHFCVFCVFCGPVF